jgi:hypothetical protein
MEVNTNVNPAPASRSRRLAQLGRPSGLYVAGGALDGRVLRERPRGVRGDGRGGAVDGVFRLVDGRGGRVRPRFFCLDGAGDAAFPLLFCARPLWGGLHPLEGRLRPREGRRVPSRGSTEIRRGSVPSPSGSEASLSGMEAYPWRVRGKFERAPPSLQGMMRAPKRVLSAPSRGKGYFSPSIRAPRRRPTCFCAVGPAASTSSARLWGVRARKERKWPPSTASGSKLRRLPTICPPASRL